MTKRKKGDVVSVGKWETIEPEQPPLVSGPIAPDYSGVSDGDWEAARKKAASDLQKERQYNEQETRLEK